MATPIKLDLLGDTLTSTPLHLGQLPTPPIKLLALDHNMLPDLLRLPPTCLSRQLPPTCLSRQPPPMFPSRPPMSNLPPPHTWPNPQLQPTLAVDQECFQAMLPPPPPTSEPQPLLHMWPQLPPMQPKPSYLSLLSSLNPPPTSPKLPQNPLLPQPLLLMSNLPLLRI